MKSKRTTYILLAIVLVIWALVVYSFFSHLPDDEVQVTVDPPVKPLKIEKPQTFAIDVNYRDPFFGKWYQPTQQGKTRKMRNAKLKEPVLWPQISYKGIVSDTKDKEKVFMVVINGKTYLLGAGEKQQEVLIKGGSRHSLTVSYKGNVKELAIE